MRRRDAIYAKCKEHMYTEGEYWWTSGGPVEQRLSEVNEPEPAG